MGNGMAAWWIWARMQKLELAARVMNKFASVQMWISLTCCDIARCRGADGISDGPTAAGHK